MQIPYTQEELIGLGAPPSYTGRQLDEIGFPIGGIGTGSVSLGGWGQLYDFEIFNRPNKSLNFNYTFFTLYAKQAGHDAVTRVVQGPVGGVSFTGSGGVNFGGKGFGVDRSTGAGLPHFRECRFVGTFPIARLELGDPKMPLEVALEAFNPFIPLNDKDSSIPAAIFMFHLHNPTQESVEAVLFANLENRVGHPEVGQGVISQAEAAGAKGLHMTTKKHPEDSPRFGSMALATPWQDIMVRTHWLRSGWFDTLHDFWDHASQGMLVENREPAEADENGTDVGSIGLKATVKPGETLTLPVVISWYNPTFEKYWGAENPTWKNYYGSLFSDAFDVADYVGSNLERLESETRLFQDTLFSSTLPVPVLDAVASQASILKSTTCLRLEDGSFYGFEGCHPGAGCCEGTCTHVWNYAQALPYLFPGLERSVRSTDYAYNINNEGHMTFRMKLPLGTISDGGFHAAGDGQLGGILKVYREWLISGDDEWLKELWPKVKLALEFAWLQWDADKDGVMEGGQHNTYDIEFHGPNTMMGSFYLGALRAAEEMARYLGEAGKAEEYRALFESGKAWMDENLFNGEWYVQQVRVDGKNLTDPAEFPKYQYGEGCLSDQMIGQWYAHMLGLGDLFDSAQLKATMASIFKYNWMPDLFEHANPQRIYALNDEQGLLLATWPRGGRPPFPFVYSDEVWCGIEYQVASHLIYEGLILEGLAIVKGVRDRHDGTRRNPWNEFECGNHYARSMASYSVLLALSGFHYSAPEQSIAFEPCVHKENFRCFFSVDSGWGMYNQRITDSDATVEIQVRYGNLGLQHIQLPLAATSGVVLHRSQSIEATWNGKHLYLAQPVCIEAGETLTIAVQA